MTDLSNWDWAESFTLQEAAALIDGQVPSTHPMEPHWLEPIVRRLVDAAVLALLARQKGKKVPEYALVTIGLDEPPPQGYVAATLDVLFQDDARIERTELARWLTVSSLRSVYDFGAPANVVAPKQEQSIATRERNTLLTIIAALCKDAGYDITKPAKTAGLIQSTAEKMGLSIGESTIEGHLKKIPDALEARMK